VARESRRANSTLRSGPLKLDSRPTGLTFGRSDLLRWIYLGRMTLLAGVLVAAREGWFEGDPLQVEIALGMFLVGGVVTGLSGWWTHGRGRQATENFCYLQVLLDVLLATGIVHVTAGAGSNFAPLYILVIGEGSLLLPFRGGLLVGGLASMLYVGDVLWFHQGWDEAVLLQVGLFTVVAFITGFLGDRLRRAGVAVGVVRSELEQLRDETSRILENIQTGVLTVDAEGRIGYLNRAGAEMLGIEGGGGGGGEGDGVRGERALEVVREVSPELARVLERSIQGGRAFSRTKAKVLSPDRDVTLGLSTAVHVREGEKDPSVTAIFQDISDVMQIERLNRRTERLEAVAELSASLAHEIKNPLASIRSAVEQLGRGRLTDENRETLERLVLKESDRLSRLLSQFLDFSGLRMGSTDTVGLSELLRECVTLVRQHPQATEGVTVELVEGDDPIEVEGDEDLLHRALLNLILNAVQFSGPGGRVTVTLEPVRTPRPPEALGIEQPVALSVEDTGPGVAEEAWDRIFDPFYTTRRGGSGLGLAVVHRAVEVHDGAIRVENVDGGGARFTVYLPRRAVALPGGPTTTDSTPGGAP